MAAMAPRPLGAAPALSMLLVLLTVGSCAARDFYIGGRDGWTTNPHEAYNHWAERNRFLVNDTLVFRYNKDIDAVLRVSQIQYDACNTSEPILRLDGGDSRFVFATSGPYFFISADAGRCRAGERLIIVVLAVRSPPLPPSAPPTPKPASSPAAPPAPSPNPASSPAAPSPPSPTPATSPAPPPLPPHVPSPAPRASSPIPPPSPSAGNVSSPAPAPAPMTGPQPSKSSAVALRARLLVLACLIVGGAAIL